MPPDGGFFIFWEGGFADFLIFLALHGSIDGAVYKFIHAFSALCGVIFYYLLLPLRDKNVYALNFCAGLNFCENKARAVNNAVNLLRFG